MKVDEKQIPTSLLVSDTEIVAIAALPRHAGTYACKASNMYGTHVSYANVSVVGMLLLFYVITRTVLKSVI